MATRQLQVVIAGDASGAKRAFDETASSADGTTSKLDAMSAKMSSIGKSMTLGVTLPVVGAGVVVSKWASEAAENANKVDVVFGQNADTVMAWAKDAETAFGLSEGQASGFFGSIGTMLQGFGMDAAVIPDMSKSVLTLASDLGSFHNLDTAEVMDAISASFRGEYDSVQKMIPTLSAAAVQQKAMEMTGKANAEALTEQEKAMATYQLLLEGAGPATGDFARTQDGAANAMKIATAQVRSAGEQIGSVFLPIVAKVAGVIAEWADKFATLDDRTKTIIVSVAAVAAVLGPLIFIGAKVITLIQGISAAMTFLAANPVVLVIAAVAALVAGLIYAYQNFDWFRNAVDAVWNAIATAATWVWETVLKPIFDNWEIAISILMGPLGLLVAVVVNNWSTISSAISTAWESVIKPVWDAIYGFIETKLVPIFMMWLAYVQAVWSGVAAAVSWAWANVIQPIWAAIQNHINTVLIPAFNVIRSVAASVWSAISSAISSAWGSIQTTFGWLTSAINGIKTAFGTVAGHVQSTWSGIAGVVTGVLDSVKAAWNNTIGGKGIKIPSVMGFGGADFTIPRLHSGGVVPGRTGDEVFTNLQAGEGVISIKDMQAMPRGGGGSTYAPTFQVTVVGVSGDDVVEALKRYERNNGPGWRN